MEYVLGIDVGGTTIKLGLFSAEGELLSEQKVKTPALDNEGGYQTVTDAIKLIVHATMLLRVVWIFQVLLQMTEPLVFSPM